VNDDLIWICHSQLRIISGGCYLFCDSDLVPAKKRLIEIDLAKSAAATYHFVTPFRRSGNLRSCRSPAPACSDGRGREMANSID
jgi:hypothetical protein